MSRDVFESDQDL